MADKAQQRNDTLWDVTLENREPQSIHMPRGATPEQAIEAVRATQELAK